LVQPCVVAAVVSGLETKAVEESVDLRRIDLVVELALPEVEPIDVHDAGAIGMRTRVLQSEHTPEGVADHKRSRQADLAYNRVDVPDEVVHRRRCGRSRSAVHAKIERHGPDR
jgi:hypothetical protein